MSPAATHAVHKQRAEEQGGAPAAGEPAETPPASHDPHAPTAEPEATAAADANRALPPSTNGAQPRVKVVAPSRSRSAGQAAYPRQPRPSHPDPLAEPGGSWVDRVEAFLSRLSTRDNFWHRIFSLLFLPLAFWSGIRMKRTADGNIEDQGSTFTAILPFRKFNKNWYNAMAGASLLANTEIAGGMYVFGEAGGDYTVVCKNLNYTFLRPCYGPAVYRVNPREDVAALVAAGGEFNITLEMDIRQLGMKAGEREKRVGRAEITFHVTPKTHVKTMKRLRRDRERRRKTPA